MRRMQGGRQTPVPAPRTFVYYSSSTLRSRRAKRRIPAAAASDSRPIKPTSGSGLAVLGSSTCATCRGCSGGSCGAASACRCARWLGRGRRLGNRCRRSRFGDLSCRRRRRRRRFDTFLRCRCGCCDRCFRARGDRLADRFDLDLEQVQLVSERIEAARHPACAARPNRPRIRRFLHSRESRHGGRGMARRRVHANPSVHRLSGTSQASVGTYPSSRRRRDRPPRSHARRRSCIRCAGRSPHLVGRFDQGRTRSRNSDSRMMQPTSVMGRASSFCAIAWPAGTNIHKIALPTR